MKLNKKLHILWTSGDKQTAHMMVFMYAINSLTNRWWDEVTVIVWGPAVKLAAEDVSVQDKIKMARDTGVDVSACISCAAQFEVVDRLKELGIGVVPWGAALTELIQTNAPLITV